MAEPLSAPWIIVWCWMFVADISLSASHSFSVMLGLGSVLLALLYCLVILKIVSRPSLAPMESRE